VVGLKVITAATKNELDPIYSVNKGIRQKKLVSLIQEAYDHYHDLLTDVIPEDVRQHYRLLTDQELVRQMHFPKNQTESLQARRSAIFVNFLI
jgi:RecG-like helicase